MIKASFSEAGSPFALAMGSSLRVMIKKIFIYNNYGFEIYKNKFIFHSAYLLFYPKLIKKLINENKKFPVVVINICPSPFLAKIEQFICNQLNIQFYHYPSFKVKNSTIQQNYTELKKLAKKIDSYVENYNIWIHCFHGCHRTGLIMSKLIKQDLYSKLCTKASRKIYSDDIALLIRFNKNFNKNRNVIV